MIIEAGAPFTQAAAKFANSIALNQPSGPARTYAELRERANRIGSALAAMGIAQGERVAVLSHNRVEVVELWLALERFNMVRVVLHSHFDMATHLATLNEIGARALIFDAPFAGAIEKVRGELKSVRTYVCLGNGAPAWAAPYEKVLATGDPSDPLIDVDESAPCFLQLTSGTTGAPKPWTHSHGSWRAVIANNLEHLDTFSPGITSVGPEDVNLHFHALQWASGFQTLMPYLLRGSRSVILDDAAFDPARVAAVMLEEGVTGTLVPGPMLPSILDALEGGKRSTHRINRLVIFFATPELLERTTRMLGNVWCHGFGSTEQGAPTTRLSWADVQGAPKRLESVGRAASPFFEMAVMSEKGERLPAGQVGEIVVRSGMSAGGYWDLPEKTEQSFFPGGWFRPNDIGYIDRDGFLYYLDRAKDRIVTSAGTVYPHVVETAVLRHRDVANCGVVGIGAADDQRVVAAVVLRDRAERSAALATAIAGEAAAALQSHERPERVIFVDELPTVLGGAKVQREVLRQRLVEERLAS